MTIRNLEGFFSPTSIVVIGPNRHDQCVADRLLEQLSTHRDTVKVTAVDLPDMVFPDGVSAADILPTHVDLAICLGPSKHMPARINTLAQAGCKAVLLLSPGFEAWDSQLLQDCREAARDKGLRLIGPGSIGFSVPAQKLNALLSAEAPAAGDVAFISRSCAVLNATLSWANARRIGFSAAVSLGERTDVDVGDLIDYFAQDYHTRAILLHVESISNPRKFLSAARAAARNKPVIALWSGRRTLGLTSERTHAGRLLTREAVFEAAFLRAGILRVTDLDEMFEALETLSRVRIPKSNAFSVMTNGQGLANLAAERFRDLDGHLAALSLETLHKLAPACRDSVSESLDRSRTEPILVRDNLSPEGLTKAIGDVLADPATDGLLVLQAPTATASLEDMGAAIAAAAKADKRRSGRKKALVVGLIGNSSQGRKALDEAKVPCYGTPAEAARSLMHLARDAHLKDFLMAAPASLPRDFSPDVDHARDVLTQARASGRTWLDPDEVVTLLECYQIPVMPCRFCKDAPSAAEAAREILQKTSHCVVKVISPDLPFKSQIDGVRLGLETPESVASAAKDLLSQTRKAYPEARITGVTVHPMLEDRHGLELYLGLGETHDFGPAILFGHGGTAVEDRQDVAVDLPPLDLNLAQAFVRRTDVARLLDGGKSRPALDRQAIALALVKLSQITVDLSDILEMDINPLVALPDRLVALDARVTLRPVSDTLSRKEKRDRLAITPYPAEWEKTLHLRDGKALQVRPVRPEDEALFAQFFERVTSEDLRLRFFAPVKDFSHRFLAKLTQLDYARAMAFCAINPDNGDLLGVVRLHADADHRTGEYAVMVRSDLKGIGLGWALMKLIIDYARSDGIEEIHGEVLKENTSMISVCEALGFRIEPSPDDPGIAQVTLPVEDYSNAI
ncbi:bifunctional acetate--CoA ligase family protein/GNAT family N-acetyltransferase [Roseibium sp. CAU 1637]|uniref:Bifunctional acetate--CoA ligase family protein/GNAT family N-acetyltransferase n=1 Tax=Roseibium limicola TaxID=2816037 RepID=A0A939EN52_9HYPH|nr:bifunctional acetate--CoA ligase family protein/GNAT family N-acetyltransferase [Roseibium limicola]